ncbi:unnamed protein product [Effrenium voratum]|nr:unnamed protein product [Effrenium voratum]
MEAFARVQNVDRATMQRDFASLDLDGDGLLNAEELAQSFRPEVLQREPAHSLEPELNPRGLTPPAPTPELQVDEALRVPDLQAAPSAFSAFSAPAPASLAMLQGAQGTAGAAESAAEAVVKELNLESQAEEQAQSFERRAVELRANATAVAKLSSQRALRAGAVAGETKAKDLLQQVLAIEQKASEAEAQAAALRKRAAAELRQADDFSSIANAAMKM